MSGDGPARPAGLRGGYLALVALTTAAGAAVFQDVLLRDGAQLADAPLFLVFTVLHLWVTWSFWVATIGAAVSLAPPAQVAPEPPAAPLPPTAVLLPVMNERPARLLATLRTTLATLDATGHGDAFHVYVLSDSTDPDLWVHEEEAWLEVAAQPGAAARVFYRHRAENVRRKAGNLEDWVERWGRGYRYAVVLDADSLMEGATLVEMVRRMERAPRLGILQTAPRIVNQETLLGRLQQFAVSVYGPVHLRGFALLTGGDGNYWGHNAILRVEAFARHCGLPALPGAPPLGGEILSHDFVEAALLRRAGYRTRVAADLGGSYEEMPATLTDFARRDKRWCQGNLQHLRLLVSYPFHPMSLLHFGMGAMSYLASPLWLLFLVLAVVAAATSEAPRRAGAPLALVLAATTLAMLLLPKLWGVGLVLADRDARRRHGGGARVAASALLETAVSTLVAPVFMLLHTSFVVANLRGRTVTWAPSHRGEEGTSWREASRLHAVHTLVGAGAAAGVAAVAPGLLPWMAPILAGLLLAIPLAVALGSRRAGAALARASLLAVPEETAPPDLLLRYRRALDEAEAWSARLRTRDPLARVVADPVLHEVHAELVAATGGAPRPRATDLDRVEGLRRAVLSDPEGLRSLHRTVWTEAAPQQAGENTGDSL
jgi:membrane glycosyltransferase